MKSILKYSILLIMFSITLLIVLDIQASSERYREVQDGLAISMRNTLKGACINILYPMKQEEMEAEFIRELANNINTDSELEAAILAVDTQGLLDVLLTPSYDHLNQVKEHRAIRKTMLVEQYPI